MTSRAFVNARLACSAKEKLLFANRMSGNARRSAQDTGFRVQETLRSAGRSDALSSSVSRR